MSSTAKGPTPENKSTKRQNPDDRLLSFCRLSIGVEGLAQQPLPDLHVEIADHAGSGVGAGEISAALALRTDPASSLAKPRNSIGGATMNSDTSIAIRNEPMACAWHLMLAALQGKPWPALPALPGRRHACTDAPISEDELQGVTSPTELALLLGITRQAAMQRLRRQAERHGDPD